MGGLVTDKALGLKIATKVILKSEGLKILGCYSFIPADRTQKKFEILAAG